MNAKKAIGLGIGALVFLIVVGVGLTAASIGSEASRTDAMLKGALAQHLGQRELSQRLAAMGFAMQDAPAESVGKGPVHSMLVYSTRLTVDLKFDAQGRNVGYQLDRA